VNSLKKERGVNNVPMLH